MLKWLTGPNEFDRKAEKLYGAVVAGARQAPFYGQLGVPDTPEGRFELIALHLFLALDRIKDHGDEGRALTQRTIEAFITDMDDCMREMGVGDLTVSKRVKRAAATFYERSGAYRAALARDDSADLAAAVAEAMPAGGQAVHADAIADYMRKTHAALLSATADSIVAGNLTFPALSHRT